MGEVAVDFRCWSLHDLLSDLLEWLLARRLSRLSVE